jgi:glycosyltransferase involved in cell wall biosynthesis
MFFCTIKYQIAIEYIMKKKKIAIIITKLELGGAQQTALYLARHLDRKKYEVYLIAGGDGYLDEYADSIPNLSLHLMKTFKHPVRPLLDLKAYREIKKYLVNNEIDLVHTHSSKAGFLGRMAAHAAKVPIVVHSAHGFSFHEFQNPVIHRIYVVLERYSAKRSQALIACGKNIMEYGLLNKIGNREKYFVIHAGVDLDLYRNARPDKNAYLQKHGLKSATFTVGMVGNLKKQKNPLEFVKIAKRVLDIDPDLQFMFAGDGPLRKMVEQILRDCNIEHKVKFLGWIEDPELFMNVIDVFLLTSLWEGLPCTLPQAIVSKKPCVATDIDGNREILEDFNSGFLYKPGEINDAVEAILKLKNRNTKLKPVDSRQSELLSKFDFRYVLKQHEILYDRLFAQE